uniref:Uncharacterized protein n=1 Tax=Castor canadensis TaxID=51338 RepID=A0A8C0XW43_CASCN
MGALTSNAARGSSSIRASEQLWKNLPGKQRLQQSSLTNDREIRRIAKARENTHRWVVAGPAAAAAIPNSHCPVTSSHSPRPSKPSLREPRVSTCAFSSPARPLPALRPSPLGSHAKALYNVL